MNNDLQRTEAWHGARIGKVTASRLFDIIEKKANGEYSKRREIYMEEKISEILTGGADDIYISKDMRRGIDLEPVAKESYSLETMRIIQDVGFIDHPSIPRFGASPDGLLLDMFGNPLNKGIEIKCPRRSTHLRVLIHKEIDPQYLYQMYAQMMCTGLDEWVYYDYDDRFPEGLQGVAIDISINDEIKKQITYEVVKFNSEVDQILEQLAA